MVAKEIMQSIQFLKGKFSPSEAADILKSLIGERINTLNIQRLRLWERNHSCNTSHHDRRIEELLKEKAITQELIEDAKREGYDVEIYGTLQIRFTKTNGHVVSYEISDN